MLARPFRVVLQTDIPDDCHAPLRSALRSANLSNSPSCASQNARQLGARLFFAPGSL